MLHLAANCEITATHILTLVLQCTLLLRLYQAVMKCFHTIVLCTVQYCALIIIITVSIVQYFTSSLLFCAQCSTVPSLLFCAQCSTLPPHYCSVHNAVLCPHHYYYCMHSSVLYLLITVLCTMQYCALIIIITLCIVQYFISSLLFCAQCSTVPSSLLFCVQ